MQCRRAFPQVRGQVKDNTRPRTTDTYDLDERPGAQADNVRKYLALVENDAYIYAVSSDVHTYTKLLITVQDPETRSGPYYHSLIYKVLKATFFSKSSDDGVVHQEYFNPVRAETVALIATSVRHFCAISAA